MDNSNKSLPLVIVTVWYDDKTPNKKVKEGLYISWNWLSEHIEDKSSQLYRSLETAVKDKKEQLEKKYGGVE